MADIERTLAKFKIKSRKGNCIKAFCPTHDDEEASLNILITNNKILLYCFAGCKVEGILKAAGLTFSDLFVGDKPPVAIHQYRNLDGSLHHEKLKYKTPKGKRFAQRRIEGDAIVDNLDGIPRIPYNYPKVLEAQKQNSIILYTEGEKDADTAELLGYVGTTMGGASDWREEYKHFFKNTTLVIIPDKDSAGTAQASKIAKSLGEVCKSLKVLILPEGKDLTEWVELGNSKLKPLIDDTAELVTRKGIPEPQMDIFPGGYTFSWNGLNLKVVIDRIRNGDEGEICVYEGDYPLYISGIKLLSVSHKSSLARALKTQRNLDWDRIINQATTKVLTHIRSGEPVIWLDSEVGNTRPEYLLYPLFVKNAPNIIYADRSSAKSLFITLIDIALTLPWHNNPIGLHIKPDNRHRVLFGDWENDAEITGWQKGCLLRGMGLEWCDIPYLHCSRPLADSIDHIRDKINETNADVLIIDSLGMAVGEDLNLTKPAFNFFAALRQLPITPIILGHTSKDITNRRKTVYGNAYYENEARSVWEVSKNQEYGSNELLITLHHRKSPPFAGYHEPLAWRFIFEGDATMVEQATPDTDKRSYDESPPSETDIALRILYESGDRLTAQEVLVASEGAIKATNIYTVLGRIVKKPEFKITRDEEGRYGLTNTR